MEIRQLRYFLDIAQTEHLTQSAHNLFVTQSTLSHGLRQLMPVTVAAFSQACPLVLVEARDLRAGAIETLLLRGELDLGIAFHPTEHEEIETKPMFDERMLLVVRPSHPLAGHRRLAMQALAGLPLALLLRVFATRRTAGILWRRGSARPRHRPGHPCCRRIIDAAERPWPR